MPVHSDEFCPNTRETCSVPGCNGCRYCCPDHMLDCEECGCSESDEQEGCDCFCHSGYEDMTDAQLRNLERHQMGIVS